MPHPPHMVPWLRGVVALIIVGVIASLAWEKATNLAVLVVTIVLVAAFFPLWGWTAGWPLRVKFGLVLGQGVLITTSLFLTDHPGPLLTLFFVLLTMGARMPRSCSLFCYIVLPLLACISSILALKALTPWAFLAEGTVKNRVSAILEKIQVRDRTQAALRARELGIL